MSHFCDQTSVEFKAGKGGDGAISFRREKFVSKGGPDGGDGGKGADIVLVADQNINTLTDFNARKHYVAEDGGKGGKKNMHGKDGENLRLPTPAGTLVKDLITGEVLFDLKYHGQEYIVSRGGKGGMGNYQFKSSVHQVPRFAEQGEEGEHKTVMLELQLVADVGIIGYPSVGKSTLISKISNARPKIAAYPFTTLIPNLGVVDMRSWDRGIQDSFVVADIPGLIEGAHEGKGLGDEFLRHVSRTEVLVHVIDPTRGDMEDYAVINNELTAYHPRLAKKPQLVVINKADSYQQDEIEMFRDELCKKYKLKKAEVMIISAVTGQGLKELIFELYESVLKHRASQEKIRVEQVALDETNAENAEKIFEPHLKKASKSTEVTLLKSKFYKSTNKRIKTFLVEGDRIEQVVKMTDTENPEGLERIYHFVRRMKLDKQMKKLGAVLGDQFQIANKTFPYRDQL